MIYRMRRREAGWGNGAGNLQESVEFVLLYGDMLGCILNDLCAVVCLGESRQAGAGRAGGGWCLRVRQLA